MSPAWSHSFLDRLWRGGVLTHNPNKSKPDAYYVKDDQVWFFTDKISFLVLPDEYYGASEDLIAFLSGRAFDDATPLRALWLEYATSDCFAYLRDQCLAHNLWCLEQDSEQEAQDTLKNALHTYCVAELWSIIWKVVKDAAALSTRDYYNTKKAADTIPGKLMRHLEMVAKGKASVKLWDRPSDQPAGTIGQVFYELFGIDENTSGQRVFEIITPAPDPSANADPELTADELRPSTNVLLQRSLEKELGPEMMLAFASAVRQGLSVVEAIDQKAV